MVNFIFLFFPYPSTAGSIEALVSYIHRAETPVNVALSDPEFERHIHNAATVMRFKVAKADVLSEQSQDRVSLLIPPNQYVCGELSCIFSYAPCILLH
jgi:hypothetical protein